MEKMDKKREFINDWAFVDEFKFNTWLAQSLHSPDYKKLVPITAFAVFDGTCTICLFGRASNDSRINPVIGSFKDGNRIITTSIIGVCDNEVITSNTIYTLGEINEHYKLWCETNGINPFGKNDQMP